MFIIPLLLAIYLFTEYAPAWIKDTTQIVALVAFVLLLGIAGFFGTRSAIHTLLRTAKDAAAIAEGDITRRLNTNMASEISELAKNFNRITSRLQQTVDNLQASKKQMQTLLAQVCASPGQPHDMSDMFNVFLNTLLSLAGLNVGAIFLVSSDGKALRVRVSAGLGGKKKSTVIPMGEGVVGWVASHGQMVTTSESMPWGRPGGLTELEKSMPWAIHVPMGAAGKTRGVISMGSPAGQKGITGGASIVLGHPVGGENILRPVGSLPRLCPIVRHHHERYDGKGYPDGLKGEESPLA